MREPGNAADAVTVFRESFEQGGLQDIVIGVEAMLAFCFVGFEGVVPGFPNAQGGCGHAAQMRDGANFVQARFLGGV